MAKKRKRGIKPKRELTHHQLATWQRQQRRQRIIFISGVSIIAAALVMVLLGWYLGYFRPLHETVIVVNDRQFNMRYYIDMLKFRGEGQPEQGLYNLTDQLVADIERMEVVREGAAQMGVTVDRKEIAQEITRENLPNNEATRDIVQHSLLTEKLLDGYFETEVPQTAPQVNVMAMLLESEAQAAEIRERLVNGDNFTALAEQFTTEMLTRSRKGDLGWHPQGILTDMIGTAAVDDYAFGAPAGILSQPREDEEITKAVGYWLIKVISPGADTATEAHVQAMVLGSETEAEEVSARLVNGDNFTALAKEYSQLPGAADNGGDMGTVSKGQATSVFDQYVFGGAVPGEVSPPLRDATLATKGGWWLIKVVAKEADRQIDPNDRQLMKQKALNEWAANLFIDSAGGIQSFLDTEKRDRAVKEALK